MKDILINEDWSFAKFGEDHFINISLPHDAMIFENRDIASRGGKNISYFLGHDYEYHKLINITEEDLQNNLYIYFEGIYQNADIYLNNKLIHHEDYGYNSFYVEITNHVKLGANTLKVVAYNSKQPNSRWYSGSGIYRNVHLITLPKNHILLNSIRFIGKHDGSFSLSLKTSTRGKISVSIFDNDEKIYLFSKESNKELVLNDRIKHIKPWSAENPYLYQLKLDFEGDRYSIPIGFRTVTINSEQGLLINNQKTVLLGACIHHDNGLLGAIENPLAAYRKIKLLKEAGYNAIRSAHNPISNDLLKACDELGMYVLDEYVDCWFMHKTMYDYASFCKRNYKEDITKLVDKDFNHPSVIMYSTGNEVGESSKKEGVVFAKTLTVTFHSLDNTRPVTCGINIFFNFLAKVGLGVYSDKKAKKELKASPKQKKKSVGSEFFNDLVGKLGAGFMKKCAALKVSDLATRKTFEGMDIAGYNYGIARYKKDIKHYPNRIILGSETFCSDAGLFYDLAQKYPRIIGDFVWAGFDYIGEVGVGSWTSAEYCNNDFSHGVGWLTAGSGRIDITGRFNSEVDYTKVCFAKKDIAIGVVPVNHYKSKHSASCWKCSGAYPIYNYPGYENQDTEVEVYARTDYVSLFINDKFVARKHVPKDYLTRFKIKYQPGTVKAVGYDKNNNIIQSILSSGSGPAHIATEVENNVIDSNLRYIRFYVKDDKEILPAEQSELEILNVTNGELLGLGNGCSYSEESYKGNKTFFFYGEALAVIKTNKLPIKISYKTKFGIENITINN